MIPLTVTATDPNCFQKKPQKKNHPKVSRMSSFQKVAGPWCAVGLKAFFLFSAVYLFCSGFCAVLGDAFLIVFIWPNL